MEFQLILQKCIFVFSAVTDIGVAWFLNKTLGSPLRTQDTFGEHFSIFSNNKP